MPGGLFAALENLKLNLSLAYHQAITIAHDHADIFQKDPEAWARFTQMSQDVNNAAKDLEALIQEVRARSV